MDTAQVYLEFDPGILEALSLVSGGRLEYPLQSRWDNSTGAVAFAGGTVKGAVTAPFILCVLSFRARAATGPEGVAITFSALQAPRQTKAIRRGENVTGPLAPLRIVVR